ncbi:hypothetical protein H8F21_13835 [Pseudomonas sp. P66]|uniref:ParB/Spo0J HTH domain-containing protein n=1 Tax=Pseudomonas arcuscaelestis TaxID=2710591 RepID=A0ABS2C078_9PSED|nr:hypothetical protein [Pseudomonas arcuscaelestis]MBM5458646.1 hypothetical protein [Pseudomonas arcuscaelestis]
MTTPSIASNLITPKAVTALQACNSLRKFHDVTQHLVKEQQLGLDFAPKRNNAFALPVALLVCDMADSIRSDLDADAVRGFADAYKAGDHVDPISVIPENGKLRVGAGFARYAGLMLAISEGCTIKQTWVMEMDGNPLAALIRQLNSNRQVPMKPLELANAYRMMMDEHGCSIPQIATLLHVKADHVRTMLDLDRVAPEVKEMVLAGQVSAKRAVAEDRMCRREGSNTVVHMQGQLAKAKANGFNKITDKSVGAPTALFSRKDLDASVPALLKLADALEEHLPFMEAIPDEVTLQLTLTGNLQALISALANLRNAHRTANGEGLPAAASN